MHTPLPISEQGEQSCPRTTGKEGVANDMAHGKSTSALLLHRIPQVFYIRHGIQPLRLLHKPYSV